MSLGLNKENLGSRFVKACESGDILVFFQPMYDAISSKIAGAEALARWRCDNGEIASPAEFVPLLEETGLVTELDWYVLNKVCEFLKTKLSGDAKHVPVSVNFSRLHTNEEGFVEKLCKVVDGYGIDHKMIEIEITESALAAQGDKVIGFVKGIRGAGFRASIDDFGSGLSSLNFVKDVPASVLKIDKSLLSGNCENEKERIVLESIFDFAHRLKLTTVAEGVETKEQLGFLRTCGCELIQGFLFAKPMSAESFMSLLYTCHETQSEDILVTQAPASATQLLLDVVFRRYPLIIMSNLSRNSFYMMAYEHFSTQSCPSTGVYSELIEHGSMTMHPDDKELFKKTFDLADQVKAYNEGQRVRSVVTRQLGDDGVYRPVETTNYYVKNPSADDILAITLSRPLE